MTLRSLALLLLLAPLAVAAEVEGYVYTVDGTPVAKATVTAGKERVTTSDDGHFVITAPADSIVALEVSAENFPAQKRFVLTGDPPLTITLRPKAEEEREAMMTTATTRPMRVERDPSTALGMTRTPPAKPDRVITGVVRIGKRPLAHAPVTIVPVTGEYADRIDLTADEKGRYRVTVAPGRYLVAPDPALAPRLQSIHGGRMWEGESPFAVDTSNAVETVKDVELVAAPLITGRVIDAYGKPVARADVLPVLAGRSPFEFFHEPIVRTLPDGTFAIVRPPFEERQPMEIVVTPPRHSSTRSSETAIKLPRFEPVTVRVTDRSGKAPPDAIVAYAESEELTEFGAQMLLMPHVTRRRVRADAKGEVTLHLTPGDYDFAAMAPKHQPRTVSHAIARSVAFTIALEPGATIRGRVRRGEQPVAGVDVSIRGGLQVPRGERRTSTDEKGAFVFDSLPRGTYEIAVFKHDEMIDKMLTVDAPAEVDVQLPPLATLTGRVVDAETRAPVPQFFLTIEPPEGERRMRGETHRRESNAEGRFNIAVPVGAYRVTAGAEGYLPSEPVDVQVTERGSTPVELRLGGGATVTGRVTDEDGRPVENANVMVAGEAGEIARSARPVMRSGISSANTAEDGTFTITGLETGPAQLIVRRTGFVFARKPIDVELQTRADVTLTRGLGISGVVTLGGKPVHGANVSASTAAIGSDHQNATTDERGRFTLEGLVPARYTIHASYNDRATEVPNVDVAQRRELTIELEGKSRAVIFGTVTGIPRSGGKVTRGHVFAQAMTHGAEGTIDPMGNYRIENAPTGTVDVVVQMQTAQRSSASARKQVEVAPGQTVRLDLDLTPALTVSGRVTLGGSKALRGAQVAFISEEHGFVPAATRDDGTYDVGLPSPGRYQIHVTAEQVTPRAFQTIREFRGSETFDIQLNEQTIEGLVIDAGTRQPVANAVVSLLMRGGPGTKQVMISGETITNAAGQFTMTSSAAGPHLLVVSSPGHAHRSQEVSLGGTETIRARFELTSAGALRVRVVDARNGTPLEAHLIVFDERGQPLPARGARSQDGTEFVFSLAPGKYKVTVMTAGYAEKSVEVTAPGSAVIPME